MRKKTRRALTALTMLTFTMTGVVHGQDNPASSSPVVVGSRVRLRSAEVAGRPRGLVVAIDEASLTLSTDGGLPLKLSRASITSLDASLGRRRNVLQGLAAGALVGLLFGAGVDVDPNNCGPESTKFCSRGEALAGFSIVFGGWGAAAGAFIKTDRWAPVTLGASPGVPRGNGRGFTVAVRF